MRSSPELERAALASHGQVANAVPVTAAPRNTIRRLSPLVAVNMGFDDDSGLLRPVKCGPSRFPGDPFARIRPAGERVKARSTGAGSTRLGALKHQEVVAAEADGGRSPALRRGGAGVVEGVERDRVLLEAHAD